jgi:stage V sporulation protein R
LFFQPQIRTKIMNEGWASYWHETLFMQDDRIKGHEVDYARVNAGVTSMPRVGLNPYALGMRLFYYIEETADKGRYSFDFRKISDSRGRRDYDAKTGQGRSHIFKIRENLDDFQFIQTFIDQDFVDFHKLFVVGKRLNQNKMAWEYYVRSRKAADYRQMLMDYLYHPPHIEIDLEKTVDNTLCLVHRFEHKPLVQEFIFNTMMGIEYLWGGPVQLETAEVASAEPSAPDQNNPAEFKIQWQRVVYTMEKRKLSRRVLYAMNVDS